MSDFNVNNKIRKWKKNIQSLYMYSEQRKKAMRAYGFEFWSTKGPKKELFSKRSRELYVRVQVHAVILMYACAQRYILGNSPAFDSLVLSLVLHAVHPEYPSGKLYGSHLWLRATPSLFHTRLVDSRIWWSWTSHCPESARKAMSTV